MTSDQPTAFAHILSWVVIALALAMIVWGVSQYGISTEVHQRFWADIFGRTDGPMTFRFFLQPAMAAIAAANDGLKDARDGHKSFFWTALWRPSQPAGRLREGLISIGRVMLLGIGMDVIYQHQVFDRFYPVEAVMIAIILAVIPYFVLRWFVERIASWTMNDASGDDQ